MTHIGASRPAGMQTITDPILTFTVLSFIILVSPVLSERLRIPDLVLLLGFGALLGPNGLHLLGRDAAITMLGSVGMLYIMFLAGLEIDLYRLIARYRRSLLFGILTFAIPQGLGTLAGRYVLGMDWAASVLLASMFASHTLLAYPLASRLGIARTEPVTITVGATIITDTLALMVLAVVADSSRGIALGPGFWGTILLGFLVLVLITGKGIPLVTRWFFTRVTEKGHAQYLFVIVVVCVCAYLSHFARLEPIIGAFLAGAAFNRLIPEESPLMSRVTFVGNTIFIPVFLISTGMLVNPRAMLSDPRSWAVGATMVMMVVITKYLAAHLSRLLLGYSRSAGQVMFGLSVVQAAATLAAVIIGYTLGIFDATVLNGAVAMILVTCLLGSWMVDRYGRRMAVEMPLDRAPGTAEQRFLLPVSNERSATSLLDLALLLRNPSRPGGIYPLAIVRNPAAADRDVARAEETLEYCIAHAASADTVVHPTLRAGTNLSDEIIQTAKELRSTKVILGWSARQAASIRFFGTISYRLRETCEPRLLFCRLSAPLNLAHRVLVPLPPLSCRRRDLGALAVDAKRLAQRLGAELRVYVITEEADRLEPLWDEAKSRCRQSSIRFADWSQAQNALFADMDDGDIVLLPMDRRDGIAWSPELDHLPERIVKRSAGINLLLDYPSLTPQRTDLEMTDDVIEYAIDLPVLPVDLCSDEVDEAVDLVSDVGFSDQRETAHRALAQLVAGQRGRQTDLGPEIVLLHDRVPVVDAALLIVCYAPDGLKIPARGGRRSRIVLILLGPASQSHPEHRKTLSIVVRWMLKVRRDPQLAQVSSAQEFCELLRRTIPMTKDLFQ
jgi:Kef-type K+ transport system membrane component KefB